MFRDPGATSRDTQPTGLDSLRPGAATQCLLRSSHAGVPEGHIKVLRGHMVQGNELGSFHMQGPSC